MSPWPSLGFNSMPNPLELLEVLEDSWPRVAFFSVTDTESAEFFKNKLPSTVLGKE